MTIVKCGRRRILAGGDAVRSGIPRTASAGFELGIGHWRHRQALIRGSILPWPVEAAFRGRQAGFAPPVPPEWSDWIHREMNRNLANVIWPGEVRFQARIARRRTGWSTRV